MNTVHLLIACATALALAAILARSLTSSAARRAQLQREIAMHERAATAPTRELATAVEALTAAARSLDAGPHGPSRLGHRVTVHTKMPDDQTLFGVVVGDYTDRIALEDAEYVNPAGATALPGRQDIARGDIAWIDVHGRVAVPDQAPAEGERG